MSPKTIRHNLTVKKTATLNDADDVNKATDQGDAKEEEEEEEEEELLRSPYITIFVFYLKKFE